jgi:hypothetical protein
MTPDPFSVPLIGKVVEIIEIGQFELIIAHNKRVMHGNGHLLWRF